MSLELYESRGNIDKINASFFSNKAIDDMKNVSPDSEVYVDKLRDEPGHHTWSYVTDTILYDDSIAYVVVRSNKRQLLLISHDEAIVGEHDKYLMVWSQLALSIPEVNTLTRGREYIITSSNTNVQTKFYNTVLAFVNHYKAKKNWDIIVVKKDLSLNDKHQNRKASQQGMEIKPPRAGRKDSRQKDQQERAYSEYVRGLQKNLSERLREYIKQKIQNISDESQLTDTLKAKKEIAPKKLKIGGFVYQFAGYSSDESVRNRGLIVMVRYKLALDYIKSRDANSSERDILNNVDEFRYKLLITNLNDVAVTDMKFYSNGWRGSDRSFNEGLELLKSIQHLL